MLNPMNNCTQSLSRVFPPQKARHLAHEKRAFLPGERLNTVKSSRGEGQEGGALSQKTAYEGFRKEDVADNAQANREPTHRGAIRKRTWIHAACLLALVVLVGLFSISTAQAQSEREPLPELPPLEVLLDYAVTHAPELNVQAARIAQNRSEVVRTRRSWMDGATVSVGASYGSFGNQLLDEVSFGQSVRVGLKVSLFDLFGRDAQVGVFESRLLAAQRERDVIRQRLRQTLIQRYYDLRRARDLVRVRSEAYESTQTHKAMLETAFQQGTAALDQVSRVTEVAAKAQAAYAEARIDYLSGYALLENLLGTPLDTLRPATASTR